MYFCGSVYLFYLLWYFTSLAHCYVLFMLKHVMNKMYNNDNYTLLTYYTLLYYSIITKLEDIYIFLMAINDFVAR